MRILLIGSGGREHAIADALSRSNSLTSLYAAPGNPGIFEFAEKIVLDTSNFKDILDFCKRKLIDLVIIGPEQPLADGLADVLRVSGINVFGPSQYAAQLESSKSFAKNLMLRIGVPTAAYNVFTAAQTDEAHLYIDQSELPIVLKADGLAAGKGVIIAKTHSQAHSELDNIFDGAFQSAGHTVVIEEYLQGMEASVFAICDGDGFVTLAPAQDHKQIGDNDTGKNTGGMGSYAPAPIVSDEVLEKVCTKIINPVLKEMKKLGAPFIGCLYCGLMIDNDEPKVVEFNVRFGDPEAQTVLNLFEGDFAGLLYSAALGKLDISYIKSIANGFSTCVIAASEGYPDVHEKGFEITGIKEAEKLGVKVFHSGTALKDDILVSNGGRVLGVTSKEETLEDSIKKVYNGIEKIHFQNMYYRKDIGRKAVSQQ